VPNLDEALAQLRLEPLHEALRATLDPAVLANIINAAEMEATGAIEVRRRERCILEAVEPFIERGNRFYKLAKQLEMEHAATPVEVEPHQSALLVGTLALPRIEPLFPSRWPETARKVLPSDSPGTSGTAVWAPVLAWALLRGLPLDGVSVFDRLRMRNALARTFHGLGMSGEDGWRGAARVRFLLHRANPLSRQLSPREWQDPDVQWLTGTHQSEGVRYFNQESHESQFTHPSEPSVASPSGTPARKASKAAAIKPSSQLEPKTTSSSTPDGSGAVPAAKKTSTGKAKKSAKKSDPSKRKS
jgi:hypothetical protein